MTADEQPVTSARRHRLRHGLSLVVVSALLLWAVIAVIPGISATSEWSVLLAALVIGLVSALLRPALALLATVLGWVGVVLVGLFAQALIFYAALSVTPDIELSGFWPAFWASWLYAFLVG